MLYNEIKENYRGNLFIVSDFDICLPGRDRVVTKKSKYRTF